jgi:hypothetical protein
MCPVVCKRLRFAARPPDEEREAADDATGYDILRDDPRFKALLAKLE